MTLDEILKDIRKRCRMVMNGVASASMRAQGLNYKLNFGVPIQDIKAIAQRYQPDAELAETLWKDGTRELKILATLLYPKNQFSESVAKRWISEIPNQEIREQLTVNLLQHLPYVEELGEELAADNDTHIRTTAYWFLGRYLLIKKGCENLRLDRFPFIWSDIVVPEVSLRNASLSFLKFMGRISKAVAHEILEKVDAFRDSKDPYEREAFESLNFEFEFFFD